MEVSAVKRSIVPRDEAWEVFSNPPVSFETLVFSVRYIDDFYMVLIVSITTE